MNTMDYAQMFALKPEERALRILICAKKETALPLPKAEFVDPGTLPQLPLADQSFDLVLCPNVLFTEGNHHTENFIREVLTELIRIGSEVRVLPLVDQQGMAPQHLGAVIQALQDQGVGVELRQVQTTEEAKPSAMLRLWDAACVVKV